MEREQCTFYRSFYISIMSLPAKYRGDAALVIIEYLLFEKEPELPQEHPIRAMFEMGRPGLIKQINKAKSKIKPEEAENKPDQKITNQSTTQNCPNISQLLESVTIILSQSLIKKELDQNELKILFDDLIFDETEVKKDISEFGGDAVVEALRKAKKHGAKSWKYVHTCLSKKDKGQKPAEFQRHGEQISPMMQEAARKLLEEESA